MGERMPAIWAVLLMVALLVYSAQAQVARPRRPTFVLGDSLVDPGNNNYILTLAKSNFPPNGIDFPGGRATGRFCNGRTVADVLSELINEPFLPPFNAPTTRGAAILGGINYASAAAGILDDTGANYVGRIDMNTQLRNFQTTQQEFSQLLGPAAAAQAFRDALYFINIGSNDYINNYLIQGSQRARQYTPTQYAALLTSELSRQIRALYSFGARKITIFDIGPLGCIPSQIANNNSPGTCVDFINNYVRGFNRDFGLELNRLAAQLTGSILLFGNSFDMVLDRVNNPAAFGLTVVNRGCCGVGNFNGQVPCILGVIPCANRDQYLFWDPFHPTDAVNEQLARKFFSGDTSVISPINVQQLAALP